jgi:DNA-binding MarR family transcriptional regulator
VQDNQKHLPVEQDKARAVIKQFVRADRLHRQAVESTITAQTGLHRSQHMLLMRLSCGCMPSQKQLAKDLGVSPAAIAVALKKLETDGYITRDADTDDCRCNRTSLTEKGRSAISKTCDLFACIDTAMVQGFNDDELDALLRALERIEQNLHTLQAQPLPIPGKDDTQ